MTLDNNRPDPPPTFLEGGGSSYKVQKTERKGLNKNYKAELNTVLQEGSGLARGLLAGLQSARWKPPLQGDRVAIFVSKPPVSTLRKADRSQNTALNSTHSRNPTLCCRASGDSEIGA